MSTSDPGDPHLENAQASAVLLEQIFNLWVDPEIERRETTLDRTAVTRALVVMKPGQPVRVSINDEVVLVASVRATRPIEARQEVTIDDFDEISGLRPQEIDPDAGWICFAQVGQQVVIAHDFRRNKARASRLLSRASEFLRSARLLLQSGLRSPAVDCAYAAAELSVVSQMLFLVDDLPRDHSQRRRWFVDWTELGNAPTEHSHTLSRLAKHRRTARYAEKQMTLSNEDVSELADVVDSMIRHAQSMLRSP